MALIVIASVLLLVGLVLINISTYAHAARSALAK